MKPRAIIVDDEIAATGTLEAILKGYCPGIELVASFNKPKQAAEQIPFLQPDLIFLDINMPGLNGFSFLEKFPKRTFDVIFVTAYDDFAVSAFRENAVDYLLKPVEIEMVIQAVSRVLEKRKSHGTDPDQMLKLFKDLAGGRCRKISLATSDGVFLVPVEDIVKIVASQSYSDVFISDKKKLLISKNIGDLEKSINDAAFFRVHKSFLINLHYVTRYSFRNGGEIEMSDGSIVLLSRRKKDEFIEALTRLHGEI